MHIFRQKPTVYAFLLIILIWFSASSYKKNWSRNHIHDDVVLYYAYLPTVFMCHDISLSFIDHPPYPCKGYFWIKTTPEGRHYYKFTLGLSILYLPFFLIGLILNHFWGEAANPNTVFFQVPLVIGSFIYVLIGLTAMRKVLLNWYNEWTVAWTISGIYLGTNLFWYTVGDPLYSHAFNFSLICLLIYYAYKLKVDFSFKTNCTLGFLIGLIVLIRPINMVLCLFPLGIALPSYLKYYKENTSQIKMLLLSTLALIGCAVAVLIPQLIFWKASTGHWILYSYGIERFYLGHPKIIETLFGYRKGLFVYTPLLLLACMGTVYLPKKVTGGLHWVLLLILIPFLYLTSTWWCWWYGGSFGLRPVVDAYPFFAIPLAAIIDYSTINRLKSWLLNISIGGFIGLNIFQSYQYDKGIIHYAAMTKASYWSCFGQLNHPSNWTNELWMPDGARAVRGLDEDLKEAELMQNATFCLRAPSTKFIGADLGGDLGARADKTEAREWETFKFIPTSAHHVALQAWNNMYLSLDSVKGNRLYANKQSIDKSTQFELHFLGENKIALRGPNGNYIRITEDGDGTGDNSLLKVDEPGIGVHEQIRVYMPDY